MTRLPATLHVLFLILCLSGTGGVFAQTPQPPRPEAEPVPRRATPPPQPAVVQPLPPQPATIAALEDSENANQTRQRLNQLLRQYPPAVAQVFQLDPSLLTRPDYMAPYPALAAFLQQHPDIVRNPSFFFGQAFGRDRGDLDPRSRAIDAFGNVLGGAAVFAGLMAALSAMTWLIRQIIEHRRWLRGSKMQAEIHAKLMDRLTSNEDLLAYIQTPAGRRFLDSVPVSVEAETRPMGAPVGRMLWSVQAGVVLSILGLGLWLVQRSAFAELAQGLYFLSVVTMALGIGFVVSAVLSYFLSVRLGLFAPPKPLVNG